MILQKYSNPKFLFNYELRFKYKKRKIKAVLKKAEKNEYKTLLAQCSQLASLS